ncbi:hypothetical protein KC19_8G089900 [Ceratodon purpureus]|uniref:DYW domain-containing protein n=1 Tax=Ceratodon purpureus TaxID=3225 RepID=A0A8T0H4Z7_CERPU|nr:hypothetical protein KC19_8G089900 [Ceratodon purpureus]
MYRCFWTTVILTHSRSLARGVGIRSFSTRSWVAGQRRGSSGSAAGASGRLAPGKEMRDEGGFGGERKDVSDVHQPRSQMDRSIYVGLLQNCTQRRSLVEAKRIHAQMMKAGVEPDIFLGNLLISMYVKCRSVVDAHRVFQEMPRRDVISWNSLISGYAQQGFKKKAFQLFGEMQKEGFVPNKITYISMLTACASPVALEDGKQLHSQITKAGYHRDLRVGNSLLSMYGRCGDLAGACQVFNGISPRDVISYNAMLGLYANQANARECVSLYEQMLKEGLLPDKVTYINMLESFNTPAVLKEGKRIHGLLVKDGLDSDVRVGTALVSMFVRCGDVATGKKVFEGIAGRDVVAWNALIAALAKHGHYEDAFEHYYQMRPDGVVPNRSTYLSILNAYSTSKALEAGKFIYKHICEDGLSSDVQIGNALISMYSRCGDLLRAREFFDSMPKKDLISWNAIIAGYARREDRGEAMNLYRKMQSEGVKPGRVTFLHLLSACANATTLAEGKGIHQDILRSGIEASAPIANALMSMYRRCGNLSEAQKVFEGMQARDVISWNSIIAGHGQHGSCETAFKLFLEMQNEGLKPDDITFVSVLSSCKNPQALDVGKQIHKYITDSRSQLDVNLGNALITMYIRCGSLEDASQVFHNLPHRDVMSWTAMIGGFAEHGEESKAFDLFWQMQDVGLRPVKATFSSILKACTSSAALEEGKKVVAYILKSGYELDTGVGNALISMYAKSGSMTDACLVFDNMPTRDVVSWNKMIAGYSQNGLGEAALKFARQMEEQNVAPNKFTFVSLLNACSTCSALEEGKRVHAEVVKRKSDGDVHVGAALISMYAKCGSLEDAKEVFDNITEKNVVTWNAMINGYAQHGLALKALDFFNRMEKEGIKPDGSTFTSVLSACNHAGLVDEGLQKFSSMESQYGITPTIEHYGCLVGLLGRAGRLKEAETFINQMPCAPDAAVWETLLGACRIHGDVQLAEHAAAMALKLNARSAAVYVLLSNVYAAVGRWEDVAKIRRVMEGRGVKKQPGRSWIEVNNTIHEFVADDRSHPETENIYAELRRLSTQMQEAGHDPDTQFVLHEMGKAHQEASLCLHSERLAISYGLISTPPGTPIRIFKNLRICGDCHTASKFISKLADREIIARDSNRFHRFQNGKCSCEDYW